MKKQEMKKKKNSTNKALFWNRRRRVLLGMTLSILILLGICIGGFFCKELSLIHI